MTEWEKTQLYAFVWGAYVLAQFSGAIIWGIILDYIRISHLLVMASISMIAGDVLYTHGTSTSSEFALIIGRILCGIAGAMTISGYAHVTRHTSKENRETRVLYLRSIFAIASAMGPGLGLLVSAFDGWKIGTWTISGENNAGSFLMIFIATAYMSVLSFYTVCSRKKDDSLTMSDRFGRESEASFDNDQYGGIEASFTNTETAEDRRRSSTYEFKSSNFFSRYSMFLLLLYFCMVFCYWAYMGGVLPVKLADLDPDNNGTVAAWKEYGIFFLAALVYLVTFMVNRFLVMRTQVGREKIVMTSLVCMSIGSLILTSLVDDMISEAQIIFGTVFLCIGFAFGTIHLPTLFVRLTGTRIGNLGLRMSWFFAFVGLGRLAGPIYGMSMVNIKWDPADDPRKGVGVNMVAHTTAFIMLSMTMFSLCFLPVARAKEKEAGEYEQSLLDGPDYERLGGGLGV